MITLPAGAVLMLRTWQTAQPIASNSAEPRWADAVAAWAASTDGALSERMNSVRLVMSAPESSGSATVSNAATDQPLEVFSVGCSGLVMPISLT